MQEIKRLIAGYERFQGRYFEEQPALYVRLSKQGQSPDFLVIACCDSRADPAQVLNTAPGDIFVVRSVANLVPPAGAGADPDATVAAMEFAVRHLKVKHIIVLGHSHCGGIKSLMEGAHPGQAYDFIDPWMRLAASARARILAEYADRPFAEQCGLCERASILNSLANLETFAWIKARMESGLLQTHGWYFDIASGRLLAHQGDESDEFVPVSELATGNSD